MRIAILGSGSRGNAIAFTTDGAALLVDAGFGMRALARRARAVGVDLTRLSAVLLTHEHGDHARGAAALARRVGCPVIASPGTLQALRRRLGAVPTGVLRAGGRVDVGPFAVTACRTSHDAAEPLALAVSDGSTAARAGVAYDVGRATPLLHAFLRGVACLLLEANHDDRLLRAGPYPPAVQRRIAGPGGHLSNAAAAALAATVCHAGLRTVVLTHLSGQCNRPDLARRAMRAALERRGFCGALLVARQAMPLGPFDVVPPTQLSLDIPA